MKFSNEEKAMRLENWRRSGKAAWAFAKENGLNPQTFCNWVKRSEKGPSGFVEIKPCKKPESEHPRMILIEKGDVRIHIPLSIWKEGSRVIMEGLRAAL